jgi:hypothetical protein
MVYLGTNASVSSLNLNDGQAVANRRPQHRTTNSLSIADGGHFHGEQATGGSGGTSGIANTPSQANTSTPVSQITQTATSNVSIAGSIGTNNANDALDTPSYIVGGIRLIKT